MLETYQRIRQPSSSIRAQYTLHDGRLITYGDRWQFKSHLWMLDLDEEDADGLLSDWRKSPGSGKFGEYDDNPAWVILRSDAAAFRSGCGGPSPTVLVSEHLGKRRQTYTLEDHVLPCGVRKRATVLLQLVEGWRKGHVVWQEPGIHEVDSSYYDWREKNQKKFPTKMALSVFDLATGRRSAVVRFKRMAPVPNDPRLGRVAGTPGVFVAAYPDPDAVVVVGHVNQTAQVPVRILRRPNCVFFPFRGGFLMHDCDNGLVKKMVFTIDDGQGEEDDDKSAGPRAKKPRRKN